MFFFFDPFYLLFMAPGLLLMLLAQLYVKSTFNKWRRVPLRQGLTGAQVAEYLARRAGLSVRIEKVQGWLSDHYDPLSRTLRLSPQTYYGRSVAAAAVAAHELGHALQHAQGYLPLHLRTAMVPAVNIGSYLGWILIFLGLMLRWAEVAWLGVIVFSAGALFALVTLPVEFNASARARKLLEQTGLVSSPVEREGIRKVLTAAALTYVAALIVALLQLAYYAFLVAGMRRRD